MSKNKNIYKSPGISIFDQPEVYIDVKSNAIEFSKWLSKNEKLYKFNEISREEQNSLYENFLKFILNYN